MARSRWMRRFLILLPSFAGKLRRGRVMVTLQAAVGTNTPPLPYSSFIARREEEKIA